MKPNGLKQKFAAMGNIYAKSLLSSGLLVLATGCTLGTFPNEHSPTKAEQEVIDFAVQAWKDRGLDWVVHCDNYYLNTIRISYVSEEYLKSVCRGNTVGCYKHLGPDDVILLTDRPGSGDWAYTLGHEVMHMLSLCALGDGDGDHSNPRVWSHDTGVMADIWEYSFGEGAMGNQ